MRLCVCVCVHIHAYRGREGTKEFFTWSKEIEFQDINLGIVNISQMLLQLSHCSSDIRAEISRARLRVACETSREHVSSQVSEDSLCTCTVLSWLVSEEHDHCAGREKLSGCSEAA